MDAVDRAKLVAEMAAVLSTVNNYEEVQVVDDGTECGVLATWTGGSRPRQDFYFGLTEVVTP
jgi:hypothetical protein